MPKKDLSLPYFQLPVETVCRKLNRFNRNMFNGYRDFISGFDLPVVHISPLNLEGPEYFTHLDTNNPLNSSVLLEDYEVKLANAGKKTILFFNQDNKLYSDDTDQEFTRFDIFKARLKKFFGQGLTALVLTPPMLIAATIVNGLNLSFRTLEFATTHLQLAGMFVGNVAFNTLKLAGKVVNALVVSPIVIVNDTLLEYTIAKIPVLNFFLNGARKVLNAAFGKLFLNAPASKQAEPRPPQATAEVAVASYASSEAAPVRPDVPTDQMRQMQEQIAVLDRELTNANARLAQQGVDFSNAIDRQQAAHQAQVEELSQNLLAATQRADQLEKDRKAEHQAGEAAAEELLGESVVRDVSSSLLSSTPATASAAAPSVVMGAGQDSSSSSSAEVTAAAEKNPRRKSFTPGFGGFGGLVAKTVAAFESSATPAPGADVQQTPSVQCRI